MENVDHSVVSHTLAQDVPTKNRRKLKNFFIKPKYQMKYAWYQIVGGMTLFAVTAGIVHLKLALIDLLMAKTRVMDVATQVQISQVYADTATTFMIGFAVSVTYAGLLILLMSHRVSGPMIAIVDTIEQLIKGNYGYKRPLRHGDELIPIQEHLQELSVRLKVKEVDDIESRETE